MKIIKLSQNFQRIQQNPNAPSNPDIQLQNLQNSQEAINYFNNVITSMEQVMASLRELEDTLGLGDIGTRNQISQLIKQAIMQTPAYNLLSQMNFISSVDNLLDKNQINNVKTIILKNVQSIQSGQAANINQ